MNDSEIRQKVIEMIAAEADVPASEVRPSQSLFADLGFDSLGAIELTMELEDVFGLSIPDGDAEKIKTVGQAIDHVISCQAASEARKT